MSPKTAYIGFFHGIQWDPAQTLLKTCANLIKDKFEVIELLIGSEGGNITTGFQLYNELQAMPIKLITHNTSNVDSVANVVFLAGQERFATPTARFLFHGTNWSFPQGGSVPLVRLKEIVNSLMADEARICQVFKSKTSLTEQEATALMAAEETHNPDWAKAKGFINDILVPQIPQGSVYIRI